MKTVYNRKEKEKSVGLREGVIKLSNQHILQMDMRHIGTVCTTSEAERWEYDKWDTPFANEKSNTTSALFFGRVIRVSNHGNVVDASILLAIDQTNVFINVPKSS